MYSIRTSYHGAYATHSLLQDGKKVFSADTCGAKSAKSTTIKELLQRCCTLLNGTTIKESDLFTPDKKEETDVQL